MPIAIKNLKKLTPALRRTFTLEEIVAENGNGEAVELELVHAGDSNAGWRNANDKLAAQRNGGTGAPDTEEWLRARLGILARFVIVGWRNAFSPDGKPEAYTPQAGEKLLLDILDNGGSDLVWLMFSYARNASNFRDVLDAEAVGNG